MRMRNVLRIATVLLGILSVAWVSSADESLSVAGLVLADLRITPAPAGSCPDACILCPDEDVAHSCLVEAPPGGSDCGLSDETGCPDDHTCKEEHSCQMMEEDREQLALFEEQVRLAAGLIPAASANEVRSFLLANKDIALLNTSRGAVQFIGGCERTSIVAHVPVSKEVVRLLRGDEDLMAHNAGYSILAH